MGIGDTVSHVLMHPLFWENPHQAAREVWMKRNKNAAANGGVMRTAVLGVPSFANIDTVLKNTDTICQVTHADPRCRASCVAVTAAVALMLQGQTDVNAIIEASLAHAAKQVEDSVELRKFGTSSLAAMDLGERSSIGYLSLRLGQAFILFNVLQVYVQVLWQWLLGIAAESLCRCSKRHHS